MAVSQSKFSFSLKTVNTHQKCDPASAKDARECALPEGLTIETAFCLNSSDECVQELTEKAIANSHKLKTLEERITLIDERLELAEDRIEYTRKKKWTNYISANPVNIIQLTIPKKTKRLNNRELKAYNLMKMLLQRGKNHNEQRNIRHNQQFFRQI